MRGQQILYIEDHQPNVDLVVKMLRHSDYCLTIAHNGADGIEKAISEKPDLILLDLNLPDMTGFEIIKQLRQVYGMAHIPVVIYTTDTTEKSMKMAQALGCDGYLAKPARQYLLLRTIENCLRKSAVAMS